MTSFAPALALKGNWGLSPKGKRLRNTLIGIQFAVSFTLIIIISFMYLQNHFMKHSDLGYDTENIIVVDTYRIRDNQEAFSSQIKAHHGVRDITYSEMLLSSRDVFTGWGRGYRGENVIFRMFPVHYNFLEVMGIEVTAGRPFRQDDTGTQHGVFIMNETARRQFAMELNTSFDGHGEIIGFMPDLKFASFRVAVEPMAFYVWGTQRWNMFSSNYAYIRLNAGSNVGEVMSHIRSTLAEFEPNYPFEVRFFDEILQQLYEDELRLSSLILIFSLLAIFISIVGVFGLVVFDSECRRKEIGIRKVLGSSTMEIITMFNKTYIKILLICFVIAVPVAWLAVNRWLENFAYRTPIFWWVFLLAFIAVAVITMLTVTIQNWRVANEDPVKSIKTE
jgi:putative ABC transport system permease protein